VAHPSTSGLQRRPRSVEHQQFTTDCNMPHTAGASPTVPGTSASDIRVRIGAGLSLDGASNNGAPGGEAETAAFLARDTSSDYPQCSADAMRGPQGSGDSLVPQTPVAVADAEIKRALGALGVAVVCFSAVAGGPFGIEAAVGAAGALPTLLGSVALAFCWSLPQALVTAELSTSYPSNAGYVAWVLTGLGPIAGFVNSANMMVSAVCNLPLYPVLFASYVQQLFPSASTGVLWAVKAAGVAMAVGLNVVGIEAVAGSTAVMTALVQLPFVLIPVVAAVQGQPFNWGSLATTAPNWTGNFR
jgi:hypothetical protein